MLLSFFFLVNKLAAILPSLYCHSSGMCTFTEPLMHIHVHTHIGERARDRGNWNESSGLGQWKVAACVTLQKERK